MSTFNTTARGAAFAAIALVATLTLSGCGGGAAAGSNGVYQDSSGWEYLRIDGKAVTFIEPVCKNITQAIEDIQSGDTDAGAGYNLETGTINSDLGVVIWDSGKEDSIQITDNTIRLDETNFMDFDSDAAQSARDENLADNSC